MWRSEDEMLAIVRRRAAAARGRRRTLITGSAAAVVLVAALAAATVRGGDGGGLQEVRVAAPGPTTTVFVPPASVDGPPIEVTPAPARPSPTAAARTTTTLRPAGAATTTTRPATPPTTRPLPATCAPEEVHAAFTPSRSTFATGEAIRLTAVLRNASQRECGYSTDGQLFTVRDAAGNSLGADWGSSSHVDCVEGVEVCGYTWAAGAEQSLPVCWDQRRTVDGTPGQAPPGRYTIGYTVTGRVSAPVTVTTTVEILPPPPGATPPVASCWP
ncbi:MAG: hypothetical protein ACLGI2_01165 [Acidimicrobiia bacterium]